MTSTNVYGVGVSWRAVRRWALAGAALWLPAYLRDSERQHILDGEDIQVGYAASPVTYGAANEGRKHPEQALPAIVVEAPGINDEDPPKRLADRTYMAGWMLDVHAFVHGSTESDAELLASVYGLAIRKMFTQQAGGWSDDITFAGPRLRVESVTWGGEAYTEVESARRRSVVAATATFTVVFRNVSSSVGGPETPPDDPTTDPGDWPEVLNTELEITREAL